MYSIWYHIGTIEHWAPSEYPPHRTIFPKNPMKILCDTCYLNKDIQN